MTTPNLSAVFDDSALVLSDPDGKEWVIPQPTAADYLILSAIYVSASRDLFSDDSAMCPTCGHVDMNRIADVKMRRALERSMTEGREMEEIALSAPIYDQLSRKVSQKNLHIMAWYSLLHWVVSPATAQAWLDARITETSGEGDASPKFLKPSKTGRRTASGNQSRTPRTGHRSTGTIFPRKN